VPAGNVSGSSYIWRRFSFNAVTTDRIRVLASNSPDGYSRIVELEAWTIVTYYQITGTVAMNGSPVSGVALSAGSGTSCSASDAQGAYSCSVPQGWSGSVTPALSGYAFTPAARSYAAAAYCFSTLACVFQKGRGATPFRMSSRMPVWTSQPPMTAGCRSRPSRRCTITSSTSLPRGVSS